MIHISNINSRSIIWMYQFKSKFVFALWSQTDEIREVLFKSYKNSIDHISSNIGITDTYCVQKIFESISGFGKKNSIWAKMFTWNRNWEWMRAQANFVENSWKFGLKNPLNFGKFKLSFQPTQLNSVKF